METRGYNGVVKRLTAAFALCAIPATLLAAEMQGSLTVFGTVQVDSVTAASGTTLFTGQTVSTGNEGRALVTLARGANISLSPSTSVMVEDSSVTLLRGTGSLAGNAGAEMVAGQLKVVSGVEQSLITAKLLNKGRVNVAVSNGSAVVKDPTGVTLAELRAGQALLFGLTAQEQGRPRSGGQAPGLPEEKKAPDAAKPKPAEGAKAGSGKTAIYVLIGAGAAGGIAAATLGGSKRGS